MTRKSLTSRAEDIAEFFDIPKEEVANRLGKGFHHNHKLVADDFIDNNTSVSDSESLRNWYLDTDAYIYELSAYHLEEGFNYDGMCQGISDSLRSKGAESVLVLGDGIGDLSMDLTEAGFEVTYNDLLASETSLFAAYRFSKYMPKQIKLLMSSSWEPPMDKVEDTYDAIIALDFFEHLINVDEWVRSCYEHLNQPGWFIAQNAFAIGDAEHGNSIPMHLSINNKYQTEWKPTLESNGFTHEVTQWWRK